MRNKIKKIKFRGGNDATRALTRKLVINFIREGKLTSTEKRVRVLRSQIEKLLGKAKRNQESDKNVMLRQLTDPRTIGYLTNKVAPMFKDRNSGYVRMIKLTQRESDGAQMARLEWTVSILKEDKKPIEVETKTKIKTPHSAQRASRGKQKAKVSKSK